MTWIKIRKAAEDPEVARALAEGMGNYPPEYRRPAIVAEAMPPAVAADSIAAPHTRVPEVLRHIFSGYRAMIDPSLPLSRREQEMIATVVSALNGCFY